MFPYFASLGMSRAQLAVDTARAIGLAFGSEDAGKRAWERVLEECLPTVDREG